MHDLIFALAFVAMVAAPAMIATVGGRKEYNPGPEQEFQPSSSTASTRRAVPRPHTFPATPRPEGTSSTLSDSTLPMHNSRGMANR